MKKRIALALAVAMVLSLSACGGSTESAASSSGEEITVSVAETATPEVSEEPVVASAEESEEEPEEPAENLVWGIQQTVDEFGDVTEDSETVLASEIQGDFSNTATASSDLNVIVRFAKKPTSSHYFAQVVLLEYGDTPATYLSSDAMTMKVKIGDEVTDYELTGESPNDSLFLGMDDFDFGADFLLNELYNGNDLRCIVYIGSSQYNFTVESGNFAELCDSVGFVPVPAEATAGELVNVYLNEDDSHASDVVDYFTTHIDDFEIIKSDELDTALTGTFLEIEVDTFAIKWFIKNYDNHTRTQLAYLEPESYGHTYTETTLGGKYEFTTTDDLLTIVFNNGDTNTYQIRKLTDDIFVSYEPDDSGAYVIPNNIMIRYNDSVTSIADVYNTMIPYIQNTLIPQIQ
jgi:hypothetical protein